MAKFNENKTPQYVTNKEGHSAYVMDDKTKLVTQVLTSFFGEQKFYGDNSTEIVELVKEMSKKDPQFVAKLAVFARTEFNMRSISHVLTTILANTAEGKEYVRKLIPAVTVRADDITEILSAYINEYGKPIPNSMKKGINDTIVRFDEYTLSKYKAEGKSLSMRDIMRLCHPTPKNKEQAEMWKRCIEGELEIPYTWEVELSANGNNKETWEKLIDSGNVGYMALLRNLRNIVNSGAGNLDKVLAKLSDKEQVRKSKQLPFRFFSAYKEMEKIMVSSKVYDALETAIDYSVDNIPKIKGKTAIAVDVSMSMRSNKISEKSSIACADIAVLLGVMAARICEDSIFMTFDGNLYHPTVSTKGGILSQARNIVVSGGSTDIYLPFDYLIENKIKVDRVIVLSDNEINRQWRNNTFLEETAPYKKGNKPVQTAVSYYRREVNPNTWVHAIDLQGYGTQQFKGGRTNIIAGWSERVLEFIGLAESGMETLVKAVEDYTY